MHIHCYFPGWSLAIYRELASHLNQVVAIQTSITLRSHQPFDYTLDQVECLVLDIDESLDCTTLGMILQYYAERFPDIPVYFQKKMQTYRVHLKKLDELVAFLQS
jgi:hypothetical protein